jgi:hypothetical protein
MQTTTGPASGLNTPHCIPRENVDAFAALSAGMTIDPTEREACVFPYATREVLDPKTFHLFDVSAGQEAFEAHIAWRLPDIGPRRDAPGLRRALRRRFLVSALKKLDMPS